VCGVFGSLGFDNRRCTLKQNLCFMPRAALAGYIWHLDFEGFADA
jgi:hypothetical protein